RRVLFRSESASPGRNANDGGTSAVMGLLQGRCRCCTARPRCHTPPTTPPSRTTAVSTAATPVRARRPARSPAGNRRARTATPAASAGRHRVCAPPARPAGPARSEEHTSELQSREKLVCRLLLEKKQNKPAATKE